MQRRVVLAGAAVVVGLLGVVGANVVDNTNDKALEKVQETIVKDAVKTETSKNEPVKETPVAKTRIKPIFGIHEEIPKDVQELMKGKSMPENAEGISFDDLAYLRLAYKDYNCKTQVGPMIVNKKVADEVVEIFKEIYESGFPIEKISLVDDYNASDERSMLDNNTSTFNYRTIAGTNVLSNHGKGVAVDINPFVNPHVVKGVTNPKQAQKYADRTLEEKGMIKEGDAVYKAFTSRGWEWGGHWKNPDYQHFEKKID